MNFHFKRGTLFLLAASLMVLAIPQAELAAAQVLAKGTVVGVGGHGARGSVQIIKNGKAIAVRFSKDLLFDRVPDAWLAFGKNGRFSAATYVASIKRNNGSQTIKIPAKYADGTYDTLFIWCRKFNVGIGSAKLK